MLLRVRYLYEQELRKPKVINYINFGNFSSFFSASDEQKLVDTNILTRTIKFMIEEKDEYDPELLEFVASLVHKPNRNDKLNLLEKNRIDFSQIGQSKYIDGLLNGKRNGFFIGKLN
jgi:hypothetical protein